MSEESIPPNLTYHQYIDVHLLNPGTSNYWACAYINMGGTDCTLSSISATYQ